jgi:adenine-specific DNA-methyltransferase
LKYIPEDSQNADMTQNLYIEGDNLEVLKLLRQNYYGAVKMVYIEIIVPKLIQFNDLSAA